MIVFSPFGNVAIEIVAILPCSAIVPSAVPSAVKVTVPVGSAPVEDDTPAVKVTVSPADDGFAEEVIPVTVEAGFTT